MADILIRMEMPERCDAKCPLYNTGSGYFDCKVTGKFFYWPDGISDGRPSDCPLQELPEHGDLIDLDAVVNCQYYDDMYEEWSIRTVTVRDVLYGCLEAMPSVVIPSNKERSEDS